MIVDFLYAWAKQDAGVTALIGSGNNCRWYPKAVPQGEDLPAVTVLVIDDTGDQEIDRKNASAIARVLVTAWARGQGGYAQAHALAAAIHGAGAGADLDGYKGTLGGHFIQECHMLSKVDTDAEWMGDASDELVHGVQMTFRIVYV